MQFDLHIIFKVIRAFKRPFDGDKIAPDPVHFQRTSGSPHGLSRELYHVSRNWSYSEQHSSARAVSFRITMKFGGFVEYRWR
jgi:hypothetical protein